MIKMSTPKSKKAQTEAIGLAVIVILISLAIIFALAFSLRQKPTIKETYLKAQLASNTLNALLKSDVECYDTAGNPYSMSDLIQDCIVYWNQRQNQINCSGTPSQDFVQEKIDSLLSETLKEWKKSYNLTIGIGEQVYFSFANGDQKGSKEVETYPLNTFKGIVLITLEIYD